MITYISGIIVAIILWILIVKIAIKYKEGITVADLVLMSILSFASWATVISIIISSIISICLASKIFNKRIF